MKRKRILSLLLSLLLLLPLALPAAAADPTRNYDRETQLGYALAALGLFQGYSGTDLGLDDAPTRTQALVMMLRLMGLEQDALAENSAPPFADVPADSWAAPYVGYAYAHGLTRGQSETLFGGDARAGLLRRPRRGAEGPKRGDAGAVADRPRRLRRIGPREVL